MPGEPCPQAADLVRGDRRTGAVPAHHHAVVGPPVADRPTDGLAEIGPALRPTRPDDLMPGVGQRLKHRLRRLVLVVTLERHPHPRSVCRYGNVATTSAVRSRSTIVKAPSRPYVGRQVGC